MDAITAASSEDEQFYSNAGRNIRPTSTMPKSSSFPAAQTHGHSDEHHYATPPAVEQARDAGPEIYDASPATIVAKRIFLTSVNQSKELRYAWVILFIETLLAACLVILGAYHIIEANLDLEDAPNTLLSEQIAAAPPAAVSLYYEAVSVLQLALIALFAAAIGFVAYFPHGVRQPAKLAFLIFVPISIYLSLNLIASISEDIAHKVNNQISNSAYRVAELIILPLIIVCFVIASYPACAAFVVYKFEKQSSRLLRILYLAVNVTAIFIFFAHIVFCAMAVYRAYNNAYVSPLSATVRLSYAVCAFPVSWYGIFVMAGSLKPICSGSRPIGVWTALLAAAGILVMYDATPLLAGMVGDAKGDIFDFIYVVQFILHCGAILAWTVVILLGAVFAYMR